MPIVGPLCVLTPLRPKSAEFAFQNSAFESPSTIDGGYLASNQACTDIGMCSEEPVMAPTPSFASPRQAW